VLRVAMARIIAVEDEPDLQLVLDYNLTQAGHQVTVFGSGREALLAIRAKPPDLVLLDLMLPDIGGAELCRELKRHPATRQIAIVMLTAKGEEVDRVVGFELGVDDYITKPFSIRELVLRISAVLRRGQEPLANDVVEFGDLRIESAAHRVWVDNQECQLTALEFKLLAHLHARRGRVLSRESLLDAVWGITAEVTTRTVDAHVKRLREKLGRAAIYVETVRGIGYRFASDPAAPSTDD
jgi:two-component system, OmpR family, phosphate regulon response regulator PhoB